MLRSRRSLSIFKDVSLRTRRALMLYKVNGNNTLLVLNGTSLNSDSALLALNWRYVILNSAYYITFSLYDISMLFSSMFFSSETYCRRLFFSMAASVFSCWSQNKNNTWTDHFPLDVGYWLVYLSSFNASHLSCRSVVGILYTREKEISS